MKRLKTILAASVVLSSMTLGASTAFAQSGAHDAQGKPQYTIQVMKHLCNTNIKNLQDFEALEKGLAPVAALANTVLNCPTTGLPGDMPVAGTVSSPRTTYDFTVTGEHSSMLHLVDQMYMSHKLCESDIHVDVDHDGTVASSTCLDISHYEFPSVSADNGKVEVQEVMPPAGFNFGTIRFTPSEIDNNNDKNSLLATDGAKGLIKLDMTNDTDGKLMLHVYNFANGSATTTANASTTPDNGHQQGLMVRIMELQNRIISLIAELSRLIGQLHQ